MNNNSGPKTRSRTLKSQSSESKESNGDVVASTIVKPSVYSDTAIIVTRGQKRLDLVIEALSVKYPIDESTQHPTAIMPIVVFIFLVSTLITNLILSVFLLMGSFHRIYHLLVAAADMTSLFGCLIVGFLWRHSLFSASRSNKKMSETIERAKWLRDELRNDTEVWPWIGYFEVISGIARVPAVWATKTDPSKD